MGTLKRILSPQRGPVIVSAVLLLAGLVEVLLGSAPIGLIAWGFAALALTAGDVRLWKLTLPVGLALILLGVAFSVGPQGPIVIQHA